MANCVKSSPTIYHERQQKELCALHALNNLLQDKQAFTKKDLDEICIGLSPDDFVNPHRSVLGLGNYDVNVIMAALQRKNYEAIWFDKRKDIDDLCHDNISGYILNSPNEFKVGMFKLPIKRKHWITIRFIEDSYYNLDSKLDSPELIGAAVDLAAFLREQLNVKGTELLLAVSKEVETKGTWRKTPTHHNGCVDQKDIEANIVNKNKQLDSDLIITDVKCNNSPLTNGDQCGR